MSKEIVRRLINLAIEMRATAGAMEDEHVDHLTEHAAQLRGAAEMVDTWVEGLETERT